MTQEEVKLEIEEVYKRIQECTDRLHEIRNICKHSNTIEKNYGSHTIGIQCEDCKKIIKIKRLA